MIVMAVDIGTETGFAVARLSLEMGVEVLHCSSVNFKRDDLAETAIEFEEKFLSLIEEFNVELVVLERIFTRGFGGSDYLLLGLSMVAHMNARYVGIPRHEVPPMKWRKIVFGTAKIKSAVAKKWAVDFAADIFPDTNIPSHHAAEALCLLKYADTIYRDGYFKERG